MVLLTLQPSAKLAHPLSWAAGSDGKESRPQLLRAHTSHSMVFGEGQPRVGGLGAKQKKKGGAGAEAASVLPEEDKL